MTIVSKATRFFLLLGAVSIGATGIKYITGSRNGTLATGPLSTVFEPEIFKGYGLEALAPFAPMAYLSDAGERVQLPPVAEAGVVRRDDLAGVRIHLEEEERPRQVAHPPAGHRQRRVADAPHPLRLLVVREHLQAGVLPHRKVHLRRAGVDVEGD